MRFTPSRIVTDCRLSQEQKAISPTSATLPVHAGGNQKSVMGTVLFDNFSLTSVKRTVPLTPKCQKNRPHDTLALLPHLLQDPVLVIVYPILTMSLIVSIAVFLSYSFSLSGS